MSIQDLFYWHCLLSIIDLSHRIMKMNIITQFISQPSADSLRETIHLVPVLPELRPDQTAAASYICNLILNDPPKVSKMYPLGRWHRPWAKSGGFMKTRTHKQSNVLKPFAPASQEHIYYRARASLLQTIHLYDCIKQTLLNDLMRSEQITTADVFVKGTWSESFWHSSFILSIDTVWMWTWSSLPTLSVNKAVTLFSFYFPNALQGTVTGMCNILVIALCLTLHRSWAQIQKHHCVPTVCLLAICGCRNSFVVVVCFIMSIRMQLLFISLNHFEQHVAAVCSVC